MVTAANTKPHKHSAECPNLGKCKFVKNHSSMVERLDGILPEIQKLTSSILANVENNDKSLDESSVILSDIKPGDSSESLMAAVKKLTELVIEQKTRNADAIEKITQVNQQLREENETLQLDQLTGLNNRHRYAKSFSYLVGKYEERKSLFSCAVLDIDNFKTVNDTHGHDIGDAVLKYLATQLKKFFESECLFRFGGEEFLVLYPGTNDELAQILNETLKYLNKTRLMLKETTHIPLTFSAGVAEYSIGDDSESIYIKADKLMYSAKKAGKNRVCLKGE